MDNIQAEYSDYIESGFTLVNTADSSLSLMQKGLSEEMHSKGGAFSESLYIYYEPLKSFLKTHYKDGLEVISVGLGLGYNEILASILGLSLDLDFKIVSYESEASLQKLFKKRIKTPKEYPLFFKSFLDEFSEDVVLKALKYLKKNCVFKNKLDAASLNEMENSSKAILFDAYSNKTSESLWEKSFLDVFLGKCLKGSFLSTYASTGELNRALKKAGFKKESNRSGFANKRESTLAIF